MLDKKSIEIRRKIIKIIEYSRRGHIGSAYSVVEIVRVLYDSILHYNAKKPHWQDRDRFILSKGHACLALYVILSEKKFFPEKELWKFCRESGILGGHPDRNKIIGIEASTGSLGHGLSIALGIALSARILKRSFKTFVLISDGECNEGSTWEAILSAGNHKLDNLFILVDYNKMQSYGRTTEVLDLEPFKKKWESFGFSVSETDGHDISALKKTIQKELKVYGKSHVVICHTIKGKGIPFIESNPFWHHKSKITDEEIERLCEALEHYA